MAKKTEYVVVRDYTDQQVAWMGLEYDQVDALQHLGMGVFKPMGTREGFLIIESTPDGAEVWVGKCAPYKTANTAETFEDACAVAMVCTISDEEVVEAVVTALGADLPALVDAFDQQGKFNTWWLEEEEEGTEAAPEEEGTEAEGTATLHHAEVGVSPAPEAGAEGEEEEVQAETGAAGGETTAPAPPRVRARRK